MIPDSHRTSPISPGPGEEAPLSPSFFARDAQVVACDLIGKVLAHRAQGVWLRAMIVETEAYYRAEKASHASLGYSEKRKALFMPPGTIYMYYARGGDSFNVSCGEAGDAVLVKAGVPYFRNEDPAGAEAMLAAMQRLNPMPSGAPRKRGRLCSGQTLLCRSLALRVPDWDGLPIGTPPLRMLDVGYRPRQLVRTRRLGIPPGRDGHLPYRFVDAALAGYATHNPLSPGRRDRGEHTLLEPPEPPQKAEWSALAPPEHRR